MPSILKADDDEIANALAFAVGALTVLARRIQDADVREKVAEIAELLSSMIDIDAHPLSADLFRRIESQRQAKEQAKHAAVKIDNIKP